MTGAIAGALLFAHGAGAIVIGPSDDRVELAKVPGLNEIGFRPEDVRQAKVCTGAIVCTHRVGRRITTLRGSAASIVSANQIVTAAHIFFDPKTRQRLTSQICTFRNYAPRQAVIPTVVTPALEAQLQSNDPYKNRRRDVAVVRLRSAISGCMPYEVDSFPYGLSPGADVLAISHLHRDIMKKFSGREPIGQRCMVRHVGAGTGGSFPVYFTDCDSDKGGSGSIALIRRDGKWVASAIMVGTGKSGLNNVEYDPSRQQHTAYLGLEHDFLRAIGAEPPAAKPAEPQMAKPISPIGAGFPPPVDFDTEERASLRWAATQNYLGLALMRQGQREGQTARLEEAVSTFRDVLKERTRERVPLDWAETQSNLGHALRLLGEREGGTARLDEAVMAYRAALEVRTRERVPRDWAETQYSLGYALARLGLREGSTARLEAAVVAYREALGELTRERDPPRWASLQDNLGNALRLLGERESGTARLEEAVVSLRNSLDETDRKRVPLDWARSQYNLGRALTRLGMREGGTARLEAAVVAYRHGLEEWSRERQPQQWSAAQTGLGNTLRILGERAGDTAHLEEAVAVYRDVLDWARARAPQQSADIQKNLGEVEQLLAERRRQPPEPAGSDVASPANPDDTERTAKAAPP